MEQYVPWQEPDETRAELTVPMIYAGRLMGVLNLERPEAERFPPEFVLTAQLLALHSAQAIQQQRIDMLYSKILGEGDITKLSEMVISEASQLIEAPLACIYLWNVDANNSDWRPPQRRSSLFSASGSSQRRPATRARISA